MKKGTFVPPDIQPYNSIIQDEIGRRIRECRLDKQMTPSQLAYAMCYETTSPITKIENGALCLSIDRLYELSQILGVSTDYLLFGKCRVNVCNEIVEKMQFLNVTELEVINDFLGDIIDKFGEGGVL